MHTIIYVQIVNGFMVNNNSNQMPLGAIRWVNGS